MNYTINQSKIKYYNGTITEFPKYTSQIINLANGNAQGTRPNVVGNLSQLFPEYTTQATEEISLDGWKSWYLEKFPYTIDLAVTKILSQICNLKEAFEHIDETLVKSWVEDLVFNKTFDGMYVQKAILAFLADEMDETFRLATPEEESKGIDGYVGKIAYSIKPISYKTMNRLSESIDVKMIYYYKNTNSKSLKIEVED